jgi:hypothetical protein
MVKSRKCPVMRRMLPKAIATTACTIQLATTLAFVPVTIVFGARDPWAVPFVFAMFSGVIWFASLFVMVAVLAVVALLRTAGDAKSAPSALWDREVDG